MLLACGYLDLQFIMHVHSYPNLLMAYQVSTYNDAMNTSQIIYRLN